MFWDLMIPIIGEAVDQMLGTAKSSMKDYLPSYGRLHSLSMAGLRGGYEPQQ